jgi:toxin YoeB
MYDLDLTDEFLEDIAFFKKAGKKQYLKKIEGFLNELEVHPMTGTGKPEKLKYDFVGKWSRRISDDNRLIYEFNEDAQIVSVISARGHYGQK